MGKHHFLHLNDKGYMSAPKLKVKFPDLQKYVTNDVVNTVKRLKKVYKKHQEKLGKGFEKPCRNTYKPPTNDNNVGKGNEEDEDEDIEEGKLKFSIILI